MRELDEIQDSLYSMKVVTRISGLTADTIRVWERRYGAVEPARTQGKTRRFSAEDVRRLVLLRQATERGHRIKSVATLSEDELLQLLEQDASIGALAEGATPVEGETLGPLVEDYIDAIERFQVSRAHNLLTRSAALLQPDDLIYQLVLPALRETGRRWQEGAFSVAHEHVVSAQVRGLLDTVMRQASPQPGAPKLLVTTPAGHLHEFGALIGALLAASRGYQVIYLGPNLPERDLLAAAETCSAGTVLLSVVLEMGPAELAAFNEHLQRLAARCNVWVGLPAGHAAAGRVEGVRYFSRYEDFDVALTDAR